MEQMELLMRLHLNNVRQGPGSEECTKLALKLSGIDQSQPYRIADMGCGTGAQTLVLAQNLKGEIVAIDLFKEFLDKLGTNTATTKAAIKTVIASMESLPFHDEVFDIIWSEGAVYNIGFKRGISYWKDFLKTGGILALSEITWTTQERPRELEEFWKGEYSEIDTAAGKIRGLEEAGYRVLAHFILPEDCWIENYYEPLMRAHDVFLKSYGSLKLARDIVEQDRQEFEFYKRYNKFYGYGFYIAQKT